MISPVDKNSVCTFQDKTKTNKPNVRTGIFIDLMMNTNVPLDSVLKLNNLSSSEQEKWQQFTFSS